MNIQFIYAQKPNTKTSDDHPHNAALMVGVVCTSNLQTEISQTPILQEYYPRTLNAVYEAHALLHY
jgi:hypothetical protein